MALYVAAQNHRHSFHCSCSSYTNILRSADTLDNRNFPEKSTSDLGWLRLKRQFFLRFRDRSRRDFGCPNGSLTARSGHQQQTEELMR
jgi:hypothetical protein